MKYHHLAIEERCQIYTLMSTGNTQKEIAKHLGVSTSTICRELKKIQGKKVTVISRLTKKLLSDVIMQVAVLRK